MSNNMIQLISSNLLPHSNRSISILEYLMDNQIHLIKNKIYILLDIQILLNKPSPIPTPHIHGMFIFICIGYVTVLKTQKSQGHFYTGYERNRKYIALLIGVVPISLYTRSPIHWLKNFGDFLIRFKKPVLS